MFAIGEDMAPISVLQTKFTLFCQMFGVGVIAVIFGNVIAVIQGLNQKSIAFQNKMTAIADTMVYLELPRSLQSRVRRYYDYTYREFGCTSGGDHRAKEFLQELSEPLRMEVNLFRHRNLNDIPLFKDCSPQVVREILIMWELIVFLPSDYVCRIDDIADMFYMIARGRCDVVNREGRFMAAMFSGDSFGERGILMREKRNMNVMSVTYVDAFGLSIEKFNFIRRRFPEYNEYIKRHLLEVTGEVVSEAKKKPKKKTSKEGAVAFNQQPQKLRRRQSSRLELSLDFHHTPKNALASAMVGENDEPPLPTTADYTSFDNRVDSGGGGGGLFQAASQFFGMRDEAPLLSTPSAASALSVERLEVALHKTNSRMESLESSIETIGRQMEVLIQKANREK
jgi:CRP-like cAMP-binding protein